MNICSVSSRAFKIIYYNYQLIGIPAPKLRGKSKAERLHSATSRAESLESSSHIRPLMTRVTSRRFGGGSIN